MYIVHMHIQLTLIKIQTHTEWICSGGYLIENDSIAVGRKVVYILQAIYSSSCVQYTYTHQQGAEWIHRREDFELLGQGRPGVHQFSYGLPSL